MYKRQVHQVLQVGKQYLKQKTQLQWVKEGDNNSKYFHFVIREEEGSYLFIKLSMKMESGYKVMKPLLK